MATFNRLSVTRNFTMSPIIEGLQANVQTAFGFFGHIPTIVLVPAVIGAGVSRLHIRALYGGGYLPKVLKK